MNVLKQGGNTICYHCGESCDGSIFLHEHAFCCTGCKTVFEILNENNLCSYYEMNSAPGVQISKEINSKRFAYLDDGQIVKKLVRFNEGDVSTVAFYIPKIHCSSCIFLLENLYRLKPGIVRSLVNFQKREISIAFHPSQITLRQIVEILTSIGYEPQINLNDLERKEKQHHLRRYYLKIGIAFFAFGNIMLLSFPEYLGLDTLDESSFSRFFGYLNFILALPVMLYSGQEFFVSAWNALKQKSLNMDTPIALGIIAMFVRSSYEIFSMTGPGYFDTLTSLILLMLIGRLFQNKTYDTLSFDRDYKSYFPVAVTLVNNHTETSIPLTKLRIGDRLLIRNMELIPADSVLIHGSANMDYSFVTGEATPIARQPGATIFAGGRHVGNAITVEVIKEVSHSYLTELWNDAAFRKEGKKNITSIATKLSRWFTPVVILIAGAASLFWWGSDINKALNAFTSVLIITCPCALALSSPFTLGNVLRILGRNGIYLKNALVVEQLAKIDTVIFDKTGTLTNTREAKIEFIGNNLSQDELRWIKSLVYHSSHPLSRKVYAALSDVKVIPTEHFKEQEGKGIEGWVEENYIRIGSKRFLYNDDNPLTAKSSDFNHASKVFVGINSKVRGFFLVKNEYRHGFAELINRLKEKFTLYIVSGDNDAEKNFLSQYVPENNLIFHQQPAEKLKVVKQLQHENRNVMMLGDGLNDAGALRQSDVGLAISDDVNNFSPACDGIIEAKQFSRLRHLFDYALDAVRVIEISFAVSLLYNTIGLWFAVQGTMSPIVAAIIMPLSSVTIIVFTFLASGFAARRRGFN